MKWPRRRKLDATPPARPLPAGHVAPVTLRIAGWWGEHRRQDVRVPHGHDDPGAAGQVGSHPTCAGTRTCDRGGLPVCVVEIEGQGPFKRPAPIGHRASR